jgi:DNA segregation ATPase FtsK/SpoIIIE, S-DNA-T family
MANPLLGDRQRAALADLRRIAAARARAEAETQATFKAAGEAIEREYQDACRKIESEFAAAQNAANKEFQETTARISRQFEEEYGACTRALGALRLRTNTEYDTAKQKLESEFKEACWTVKAVYEADKRVAQEQQEAVQRHAGLIMQKIQKAGQEALGILQTWDMEDIRAGQVAPAITAAEPDPMAALEQCLTTVTTQLEKLKTLRRPWLKSRAHALVQECYEPLYHAGARSGRLRNLCVKEASALHREQLAAAKLKQDQALEEVAQRSQKALAEIREHREHELRRAEEQFPPRLEELTRGRDRDLRQAEEKHQGLLAQCSARHESELRAVKEKHDRMLAEITRRHDEQWSALTTAWQGGLTRYEETVQRIEDLCSRIFPPWDSPAWGAWLPPDEVPEGMRFGSVRVGLERIPHGIPQDERLRALVPAGMALSALIPFPTRGNLLLKASGAGREAAVRLLQAVMLRCLTAIPPGKVHFTILDPVGLGENFAAFTHLADYQERLVTSRIWTEASQIDQRLVDITAHIENVIQQFLRNQFQTLEEYNAQAGEVAEPYRIVVVANFPTNFTPEAARRLVSIAASGGRCGTYTLISVDMAQPMPQGFQLADLEQGSTNLLWKDGKFAWNDSDYEMFPLELERPADDEFTTRMMHVIGKLAQQAGRVEVPFDLIAPAAEQRWTGDTRSGLRVALGRAGALKKQFLQLGQGTAQHVLIAGKTGSGKSTLLHALITQLALAYRPEEVELYLVDFKKGVEFKTYAVHELPHARVVAIESEREFGLSVLQRLDAELKQRGERFRALGVNDLASCRQASDTPLPRVLLIVDEFQEFFVEDDKVAQEAALLLDRLVRQGRAFGIHILLGSQTLGGAYSLARATIDQMAVRIALQCGEADGHLILSKENGAARLLNRPGEAIYNDANGRVEGNELFQTVWLSEERREEALSDVRELARQRHYVPPRPQIVFEGTAPADMARNPLLERLLREPAWPDSAGTLYAWLGEAVAIKDPTAAVFRRQGGANLLLIGQQGEIAANLLSSAIVSLTAHQPLVEAAGRGGLEIHLLGAGATEALPGTLLAQLPDRIGAPVQMIGVRDLPAVLGELAAELDRRQKESDTAAPPRFFFVYGLHRFRDLRKPEDDFGFSRRGEEKPNPAKLFATLLREGPPVGIFTVAWCDTLNNLNRAVDRQGLREFEMRVLFQMSAADSSTLIDSPAASKLGLHRALFYSEDQARVEKFRPYGSPDQAWLEARYLIKANESR